MKSREGERTIRVSTFARKAVLALGSQTKNTVCLFTGNAARISPIHNNLLSPEDFQGFEKEVRCLLRKKPGIIACDMHRDYQSTQYAYTQLALRFPIVPVQHHHAHIVSCMAENGIANKKVIGVAFDGTGFGVDNTLWGAEFLICDYRSFERRGHLREVPLIGAEKAIHEPWRLAAAWLFLAFGNKFPSLDVAFVKKLNLTKWRILQAMYEKEVNSPKASSMGRLFDAAASLISGHYLVASEGALALWLEKEAVRFAGKKELRQRELRSYPFGLGRREGKYQIDPAPLFRALIGDLRSGRDKGEVSFIFHLTVAEMVKQVCLRLRRETAIKSVALSGGVWQNNLLLRLALDLLYKEHFQAIFHKKLSCNDSGISLGQAVIASFRKSYLKIQGFRGRS
jgi:hydrogenase maturation protein HypF